MSDAPPINPSLEARVLENIQALREQRGWSQSELARRMVDAGWPKYTQMTVSRTEKGERPIRLDEAATLAQVFEMDLPDLWMNETERDWQTAHGQYVRLLEDLDKTIRAYGRAVLDLVDATNKEAVADALTDAHLEATEEALFNTPAERFWRSRVQSRRAQEVVDEARGEHSDDKEWGDLHRQWRDAYIASADEAKDYSAEMGEDDA